MILTCPTCASRYFVDDDKLGPLGRTVRCAACGNSWRAEPQSEPLDLVPPSSDAMSGEPTSGAASGPTSAAEAIPRSFRAKVEAKRRTRRAMAAGVVWAGLTAAILLLALLAIVFRVQVVRLWPRTAGAYAAVRLTVNPLGLAPDNIQAGPGLQNGQAALVVTGAERNIETQPKAPAPLRVSLYDKAGVRLVSRIVRPVPGPIAAGESRSFSISFIDPPLSGVQVGVDFIVEPPTRAAGRLRGRPERMALVTTPPHERGLGMPTKEPEPRAAQPLAVNSPFALPTAARAQTPP